VREVGQLVPVRHQLDRDVAIHVDQQDAEQDDRAQAICQAEASPLTPGPLPATAGARPGGSGSASGSMMGGGATVWLMRMRTQALSTTQRPLRLSHGCSMPPFTQRRT